MKETLRSARAAVEKASESLDPALTPTVLREWNSLLARRVGTVVGNSILTRVLSQRGGALRDITPGDLAFLLSGLVESASVFLSKEESLEFAVALALAVRERAEGGGP